MLKEITSTPLAFEQIVIEEMTAHLTQHGFQLEPPFYLYKNQIVTFLRERHKQEERIQFQRAVYGEEEMRTGFIDSSTKFGVKVPLDDEVDRAPNSSYGSYRWISRHEFCVELMVGTATNYLLTSGKVGISNNEEEWWRFMSEEDLRRVLRKLLPYILTAGLERFDDRLEDMRTGRALPHTPFNK